MAWVAAVVLAGMLSGAPTAPAQSWLLVISGVGGDAEHRASFVQLSLALVDAARERFGLSAEQTVYLAERQDLAPERIDGRSDQVGIEAAFRQLRQRANAGDQVVIVLIGHGTAQGSAARFAIPGPDMEAADFAALLDLLGAQKIAFVNTTSASGGFVGALSGPDRVVVTATRGPQQVEETLFPGFFVEAFSGDGADLDKDERVSILEAFRYATAAVERAYDADGRLRTEHALLDDNGDGEGSVEPEPSVGDGSLARLLALGRPLASATAVGEGVTADPQLLEMHARRAELAEQLDALRARKAEIDPDRYLEQLEALLVQIAELDLAIRERGESPP